VRISKTMSLKSRVEPKRADPITGSEQSRASAEPQRYSPGALATILAIYIAVVIGRVGDLLNLGLFPIAKVVGGCALIVAWKNRESLSGLRLREVPLARLILVFMAWTTVSVAFSVWMARTLSVITGTVVATIIATFLIVKAATSWSAVRRMLLGTVGAAIALSMAAMVTSYAGRAGLDRDYDPNDFAYVLVGLLPCVCAFVATSKGWRRMAFVGAALWATVAILLTQSRGGLLGLGMDILLLTLFLPLSRKGRLSVNPSRRELIVRVIGVALAGLVIWVRIPSDARTRLETITTADSGYNVTDSQGRLAIWTRNLPLIAHRPWGYGAGTFEAVDGLYGGGAYRAPHNVYLQSLIELGLPGLGLVVALLVSYFRQVWSLTASLRDRSPEYAVFTKAMGISQAGLCVSGFFLSELYANELWLTVALLCAVVAWVRPRELYAKSPQSRSERSLAASHSRRA
jgi:O-Antigen ligase